MSSKRKALWVFLPYGESKILRWTHHDALNAALLQLASKLLQFAGEGCEAADRLRISIRRHGHVDLGSADVNSGSVGLQKPAPLVKSWVWVIDSV
jgi:hypothetical protein